MAKKQTGTKGQTGNSGKNSSAPKGALCAQQGAIGREQKKQASKARQAAKQATQLQVKEKALKEVEDAYASSSKEFGHLAAGHFGDYGIKDDDKIVIVRVANRDNKAVAYVLHSQVKGVSPCERKFVPVSTLRFPELQQVTPIEIFNWQVAVHMFLRKHVAPFLITHVPGLGDKWQKENANIAPPTVSTVSAKPVLPEVVVDVAGAAPACAAMFMGEKHGESHLYIEKDGAGNEAYFKTWRAAGNHAVSLMYADEGHSLHRVLVSQEQNVHIHLCDLHLDTRPYDGDLKDMKDARECLRQYLRSMATSFGIKAKAAKKDQAEARALYL